MGLFGLFKKSSGSDDWDGISLAGEAEKKGDFAGAIAEYQKVIDTIYVNRPPEKYKHLTAKIIDCYAKMGDYDKVFDMWSQKYDPSDYGAKEMYELVKVLEAAHRDDLIIKVYDKAGKKLARNKVEFLMRQKKIPEANALMNEILAEIPASNPMLKDLWLTKAKLSLSLRKWEEACKYLNKILEKDHHNEEVAKLKEFCMKQVRNS